MAWSRIVTDSGDFYKGTSSSESMTVTSSVIGLVGMGGSDTLKGGDGEDILIGDYADAKMWNEGDFSSYTRTGKGNDKLYGGGGSDLLFADGGNDSLYGGSASDGFIISSGIGSKTLISGGTGNDSLSFHSFSNDPDKKIEINRLVLDAAASIYFVGSENLLYGTSGADHWDFTGVSKVELGEHDDGWSINFGDGNDYFLGSAATDAVAGGNGNDTLAGKDGNDFILGGAGTDWVYGGDGNDILNGRSDYDHLIGRDGNDIYQLDFADTDEIVEVSGEGTDTVRYAGTSYTLGSNIENLVVMLTTGMLGKGNSLNNSLYGCQGNDSLYGDSGNDRLYDRRDEIWQLEEEFSGSGGNDKLYGGDGNDSVYGEGGNDTLYGGNGNDRIKDTGISGSNDLIYGGAGNDTIDGTYGSDTLYGGTGADHFQYGKETEITFDSGVFDRIEDFEHGIDKIILGNTTFGALDIPEGAMPQTHLGFVGQDLTGNEKVVYNQATGELASAGGVVFLKLDPGTVLTNTDFLYY